ncbi:carbohydrate-binding protein [Acinetobacter gyllenbergii]|uniref:phage nozzle protein n=1 Tax=Acinetobacter gyllenbergii TaxID=134534 RepID=UPI003AF4F50B
MKQFIMKNNFSAGELAPTLYTRTDIQQYGNGAKTLKNVIPLVEGGVRKRPGTFFKSLRPSAVRLIPFVVSSDRAYMLILRPNAIDVYNPRTNLVDATVTTPYSESQIPDLQFVQYRYEMFFTHSAVPVHRFRSSEDFTAWEFSQFVYSNAPTDDENARSPFRKCLPSGKDLGAVISLTLDDVNIWSNATSYFKGDVVKHLTKIYQATQDNTGKEPNTNPEYWGEVTIVDSGFLASDVGNFVDINGGIVRITAFVDQSRVNGEILVKLESDVKAIERSWTIKSAAFNATDGYPKCCTYFKQRLVLANTKKAPNKIWFSAVGGNANFLETTEDGDAFSVVSASGLSNSILFLEAQRGVVCLTSGGEYMVDSDGVLSPTTVNINEHTAYGAYPKTRPCRVGNELLFIQRGGERLRALSYRYEVDGLVSPEISALASHIGENNQGINEICYQQEPESLVWCVLGNGKVATITFNRDQEVIAWAQHEFGGSALSICSLPTELGNDQCYMLINRGGTICLEEITFDAMLDSERWDVVVSGKVSKSGMSYLNNLSVYSSDPNTNTIYAVQFTENSTDLLIPNEDAKVVKFGQLFDCKAELFPPELGQAPLSTMMFKAKIDRIAFYFNKTIAPEFNNELIETFTFADNILGSQKSFTGYHLVEGGYWEDLFNTPIKISHNKPLPFHLQAITMQMSINEK